MAGVGDAEDILDREHCSGKEMEGVAGAAAPAT